MRGDIRVCSPAQVFGLGSGFRVGSLGTWEGVERSAAWIEHFSCGRAPLLPNGFKAEPTSRPGTTCLSMIHGMRENRIMV